VLFLLTAENAGSVRTLDAPWPTFYPKAFPMSDGKDSKMAMFEVYLATAEKVSDRRAQANSWMLSVNSAIVALYGYLQSDKLAVSAAQKMIWPWAIPAAGAIVCLAWWALLKSFRELNRAKFAVLAELEADLPASPITREREIYKEHGRRSLSQVEGLIPGCFGLLYIIMLVGALLTGDAR
jgi:hypothetical protein